MKTALLLSGVAFLLFSQAQAMMDPDEGASPQHLKALKQLNSATQGETAAVDGGGVSARDLSTLQRLNATPQETPILQHKVAPSQDDSQVLRDRNSELQRQNAALEARLAALETPLNNVQISGPTNVRQISDPHLRALQQLNSDHGGDAVATNDTIATRDLKALEKLNAAQPGDFVTPDGKVYRIVSSTRCDKL